MKMKKICSLSFLVLSILTASAQQKITYHFSGKKNSSYNFYSEGVQTKAGRIVLKENIQSFGDIFRQRKQFLQIFN